ncbi:hypothetical protein BKA70DRAFT_1277938 [Coprinopsis sp. MPI-PUGE-AT-0042]|nr:hypothetical protein BKA70DRAFT_1277938 [Coprinopsis sp. MPI-PUGE-AT-0042]
MDLSLKMSLNAAQVLSYTQVASLTVLIVDYLETFLLEVKYMWPVKWNLVSVLFFVLRYLPLVHIPSTFPLTFNDRLPWASCAPYFIINTSIIQISTAGAEAIMFIRVHAIGGRSRNLGIYLLAHYVLSMTGIVAALIAYFITVDYAEPPLSPYLRCTSLRGEGVYLSILYGIILFNEAVMMLTTVVLGFCKYLHSRKTPLWQIFYRQGTFYFVTLALASMANMTVNIWAKREYAYTFTVLQYALHSIFTVRMVLDIRQTVTQTEVLGERALPQNASTHLSTIAFRRTSSPSMASTFVA